MLTFLPGKIRRSSLPDLLGKIDPGIVPGSRDEALLRKTVRFTDFLLQYRILRRYGKCLLRSLVLFRFLRLQGWPVEISFGVRRTSADSADITGHSWLLLEGRPFLDFETVEEYSTTYSYPSGTA
jgi:hypothetical protein